MTDIFPNVQWVSNWSEWTAAPTLWALAIVMITAGYGLWAARRGRSIAVF